MGMSTPMNEIARLCAITPPDVAVVLNVLTVHIEHLGTIENIGKAKAELVEGMKDGGTAVLNADDPRVAAMSSLSKGKTITYGIQNDADVRATDIRFARFGETIFTLNIGDERVDVLFPLNGRHNILNALAAAAAGVSFGMSANEIAAGLHTVVPPPQRGEVLHFKAGFTVVNDSYNSNPTALLSMVDTIIEGGGGASRKIIVAGEMLELGPDAANIHAATGADIAKSGVDMLIGVRGLAKEMVDGASAGMDRAIFAEDSIEAGKFLAGEIKPGDLVLIKGSRGVRTENVIEKLLEKFELEAGEAVNAAN
jgi:UDP-N-acetylmuramoyl-tripeptide--D-alanyl-D-alanine ligase